MKTSWFFCPFPKQIKPFQYWKQWKQKHTVTDSNMFAELKNYVYKIVWFTRTIVLLTHTVKSLLKFWTNMHIPHYHIRAPVSHNHINDGYYFSLFIRFSGISIFLFAFIWLLKELNVFHVFINSWISSVKNFFFMPFACFFSIILLTFFFFDMGVLTFKWLKLSIFPFIVFCSLCYA